MDAGEALDRRVRRAAPARQLRFALVADAVERFAAGRSLRVLDAGCGEGLFATGLARRHRDWTIVGVDASDALLEAARLSGAAARLANVEFERADLTGDLGTSRYDAVVAIEALEEIPDDGEALRRMIEALRPGGLFVAHVPERDWRPVLRGSEPTWRHEVRHGYASTELAARLSGLGLADVEVEPTSRGLVRLAQELRDRVSGRSLIARAPMLPLGAAAVRLERRGLTWGPPRSLIARGHRAAP
jgi:trans-aconitate methyltransferase